MSRSQTQTNRANRTYEYLTLVESVRVDGKNSHRTLFRLGEATALRETGELDRIIAGWPDDVGDLGDEFRVGGELGRREVVCCSVRS